MVDYAEGVNQIIALRRNESAEPFGIARTETDAIFLSEHGRAPASQLHRFFGEVHGRNLCSRSRKINRVCGDAASDFQHFLLAPAFELCKSRNVIFDEVLPRLDLVKVFFRANRRGRVPDVAGAAVPVIPDPRNIHIAEIHAHRLAKKNAASNCPTTRSQSDLPFNDPVSARTPQGTLQSCRQKVLRRFQAELMNRPRISRTICNPYPKGS